METPPIEMLERISLNLATKDLAACAAVCLQWRDIFNSDSLWRPRCDVTLEETLRTTPCVVEPLFVSPEMESSTLSPIGQWRLAFMREDHLWNNWRNEKRRASQLSDDVSKRFFISNNLLIRVVDYVPNVYRNENVMSDVVSVIQLYDVKTFPPALLKETTNEYVDWFKGYPDNWDFINNILILFNEQCGVAFNLDFNTDNIMAVKYKITLPNQESVKGFVIDPHFEVTRTTILGYNPITYVNSETLHVWDLNEGNELKVEKCPLCKPFGFSYVITSQTTENAVVVVSSDFKDNYSHCDTSEDRKETTLTHYFHIYNSLELRFLPFKDVYEAQAYTLYDCKIHYNSIAIAINGFIKVYNYNSHKMLTEVRLPDTHAFTFLDVIDDCFVFVADHTFKMFHPASQKFIAVVKIQLDRFTRLNSSSMLEIDMRRRSEQIWKIGRHQQKKLGVKRLPMLINDSSTRAIPIPFRKRHIYWYLGIHAGPSLEAIPHSFRKRHIYWYLRIHAGPSLEAIPHSFYPRPFKWKPHLMRDYYPDYSSLRFSSIDLFYYW